jgi:hypothetical protein
LRNLLSLRNASTVQLLCCGHLADLAKFRIRKDHATGSTKLLMKKNIICGAGSGDVSGAGSNVLSQPRDKRLPLRRFQDAHRTFVC